MRQSGRQPKTSQLLSQLDLSTDPSCMERTESAKRAESVHEGRFAADMWCMTQTSLTAIRDRIDITTLPPGVLLTEEELADILIISAKRDRKRPLGSRLALRDSPGPRRKPSFIRCVGEAPITRENASGSWENR